MSSHITDLINPMRLRLGIKRAFTGDIHEILGELFQNSQRAGAQHVRITTDDRGFAYQDDGRGLRNEADFESLIKLGESAWDERVEEEQQPLGLGIHSLLACEEVESVTFSSHLLSLTLATKAWWNSEEYIVRWRDNLKEIGSPAPGMNISVTCSQGLTESLVKVLTGNPQCLRSPAQGYRDLLHITLNDAAINTKVPRAAMPELPLIETEYQHNRLVIGLHDKHGYPTTTGLAINWFGQMIAVNRYSHFNAFLEVRHGRPVNPMAPSRRGIIKDQALQSLLDFIRDVLAGYFASTPAAEINPLALQGFYRDYREQARTLPLFVAARRVPYEPGGDLSELEKSLAPAVFSYANPPLLLADEVRCVEEDGEGFSDSYGLHSFLELTGAAYQVSAADESQLPVRRLWWQPGAQLPLPDDCPLIFYEAGQWGLGSGDEPPTAWNGVGDHTVFTFNDPSNWDVDDVDFTVGGADPQAFYQAEAWAGFNPDNDEGRDYEEMSESYGQSCEREIRKLIGNAVPANFSWGDLTGFVPAGQQIACITPEYSHRPQTVTLTLLNNETIELKLF